MPRGLVLMPLLSVDPAEWRVEVEVLGAVAGAADAVCLQWEPPHDRNLTSQAADCVTAVLSARTRPCTVLSVDVVWLRFCTHLGHVLAVLARVGLHLWSGAEVGVVQVRGAEVLVQDADPREGVEAVVDVVERAAHKAPGVHVCAGARGRTWLMLGASRGFEGAVRWLLGEVRETLHARGLDPDAVGLLSE